jgi:hypothetical protein
MTVAPAMNEIKISKRYQNFNKGFLPPFARHSRVLVAGIQRL